MLADIKKVGIADINIQIHYQSDCMNGGKNSKNGRMKRTKEMQKTTDVYEERTKDLQKILTTNVR